MAPKFGTSGLRGLVVELTPELITNYIDAFLRSCPVGSGLYVGRDLRPSSPAIAEVVIEAARARGVDVTDCGAVPTPALALASMGAGAAAVMVTGSHIPADRNGLKFYLPEGEISKSDEAAILAALEAPSAGAGIRGSLGTYDCAPAWIARYVDGFGADALAGLKIGVWSHSAVSRDMLLATFQGLGAEVLELGRSDIFIPVDTEAVPDWARAQIADWCHEHALDALVSTDGDGDRPLLAAADGTVIVGDILGQITAAVVGAERVATPVSSNTGLELSGRFERVSRSRIGSPYVIAAMADLGGKVVGYEANGGFLLGFDADLGGAPVTALATRDSLLPLVAPLRRAASEGGIRAVVAKEPARFTSADRLEEIPVERSQALLQRLNSEPAEIEGFLAKLDEALSNIDRTDGLRLTTEHGRVVHIRPSGNAPELRVYVEAESIDSAQNVQKRALSVLQAAVQA